MLDRADLHEYQSRTVEFIKRTPRAALWLDMGLGKTTSTLTALSDLMHEFDAGRALVVAPKKVARNTWPKELKKWSHVAHLRAAVIRGTEKQRVDVLLGDDVEVYTVGRNLTKWLVDTLNPHTRKQRMQDTDADIARLCGSVATLVAYLCSTPPHSADTYWSFLGASVRVYGSARAREWLALVVLAGQLRRRRDSMIASRAWFADADAALTAKYRRRWPFDFVVLDESSGFKSHETARWKAVRKTMPHVARLVELTGTPAGKGLLSLWAQVFLIDGGARLGKTYTKFRDTYFDSDYRGFSWTPKPGAEDAITARLADIVFCLTAADHIAMPELLVHAIEVDLPSYAREVYTRLERDYLAQIDDTTVTVAHAAALSNKLLQCANGFVYAADEHNPGAPPSVKYLHDAKLDALETIVEEHPGRPILVAYEFRADIPRLRERFPHAVMFDDKPETEDRWNRGEIGMLITHALSAGHGLNIQDGGNILAWYGLTWSLELYQQFNARLHRQGQSASVVHVYQIIAANTVDTTMVARLDSNDLTQRALIQALKTDIRERLAA